MSTFFLKIGAAIHSSWSSVIYFIGLSLGDSSRATLDPKRWAKVICRLDLYIDPNAPPAIGTGFFLNVPGASKDVLVTAGHNLIRPPKSPGDKPQRTQQIEVRLYDSDGNPTTEKVEPSDYHIAAPYEQSQTPENAVHDYGIILLDRPIVDGKPKPREAFGFDIVLAAMDLQSKELGTNLIAFVGGYPGILNKTPTSEFRQGSGTFGRHKDRQVLYHAGTDQGMSGAPIWVNYDGEEVVVGIQ